jgi:SAM-dependent methyltransferase
MRALVKDIARRVLGAVGLNDVQRVRTTQDQIETMLQEVTKLVVETKAGVSASQGQLGETHSLVLRLARELPDELSKTKSGVSHVQHALGDMSDELSKTKSGVSHVQHALGDMLSHTVALRKELAALWPHTVPLLGEPSSRPTDASPTAKKNDANARSRRMSSVWVDADVTKKFLDDVSTDPYTIGNLEFNEVFHHLIAPVYQPGQKIIDVGCGPGLTSFFLHDRGCSMVAVDYSQEMLNRLVERKEGRNIEVREGDAFSLPAKDEEFDGAVSRMFMTHFDDFHLILKEMTRVMRPGGSIAYSFANVEHFRAASRCPRRDASAFTSMIDRANLDSLCKAIGCDVVDVFPMGWLYDNAIIAFSLGNERFEAFRRTLAEYVRRPDVFEFMSWLDKEITPKMPPATSFHNVTILRKR